MAKGIRAVLENLVTTIEATTADTLYAGTDAFRHFGGAATAEDLRDVQSPTRWFLVVPSGARRLEGPVLQLTEPFTVVQTLEVVVLYAQGPDVLELVKVVLEDVDRLSYRLLLPARWDAENTGTWRVQAGDFDLALDDAEGGTAVLTLPVEVTYMPTL